MQNARFPGGPPRVAVVGAALVALALISPAPARAAQQPPAEVLTEDSTSVARPDGTREVTLFAGPVQLRRGAEWVPVDLTLRAGPDGVVRPVSAPHDLSLTPAGPVVRYAQGGGAALAPVTPAPLPAPVLAGHRATYPQVTPGHDLVVEATRAGFVASLRRASDPRAGTPSGPAPALVLTPLGGGPGAEAAADQVPAAAGTPSALARVVAAAPAAGPAPAPFDTTVQSTILRSDASGDPDLRLGSYDGVAVARSFLTWDLTELGGRPVTAAALRVHQDWSSSCVPAAWQVWSVPAPAGPPVGPATRFAAQPAPDRLWATSTETRGHSPACAAGWTEVDVTELVRSWIDAGDTTGTVQLRAADETSPSGWKRLGSAESPTVPELRVTGG